MSPLCFRDVSLNIQLPNLDAPVKLSQIETPQESTPPSPFSPDLASYETYNLLPVKQVPGKHGGSLITVRINPYFDPLEVDTEMQDMLKEKQKYENDKKRYEEELVE